MLYFSDGCHDKKLQLGKVPDRRRFATGMVPYLVSGRNDCVFFTDSLLKRPLFSVYYMETMNGIEPLTNTLRMGESPKTTTQHNKQ